LEQASGLRVGKRKGAFFFSREGGCSCSLLSENADWDQPVWALEGEVLEPLAAALRLLAEEADGFTLRALWVGDDAKTKSDVTLSEMLTDVRENRVKNWHTYSVSAGPNGP
jgi:hypothetical protein